MSSRFALISLFLLPLLIVATGCGTIGQPSRQTSPEVQLSNVDSHPLPQDMRRVAILPVYCPNQPDSTCEAIDRNFSSEFSKALAFEVVRIGRDELQQIIGSPQIESVVDVPGSLFPALSDRYGVDGVLFVDLTSYRPYRPISIGVRAKLVDIRAGQIFWAIDSTLDSADPRVAELALEYTGYFGDGPSGVVLQSPSRYAAFVAQQIFRELPTSL